MSAFDPKRTLTGSVVEVGFNLHRQSGAGDEVGYSAVRKKEAQHSSLSNYVGGDRICRRTADHYQDSTVTLMMPSLSQFIVWIAVGLLGGSLAGSLITWDRKGFGLFRNLLVGLAGALVGGLLFRLFGLFPGLDAIAISLRDVVAALSGSLIVIIAVWIWQRSRKS